MKTICYLKRKGGLHGFLKILDEDSTGLLINKGKEIHFRTGKTLAQAAHMVFTLQKRPRDKKPLRLSIERGRKRSLDAFYFHRIKSGDDAEMSDLWDMLEGIAREIGQGENVTDGFQKNCHTLAFEVLEKAGLDVPREEYLKHVDDMKHIIQHILPIHPPSSTPQ